VLSSHAATASSHLIGTSARDWITTSGAFSTIALAVRRAL
jgi:hypothetical protein